MKDQQKPQPESLDRPDPRVEIAEALKSAANGDVADELSLSLIVSGGVHEQHYELVFATRGDSIDECKLDCALSDRHARADAQRDPKLVSDLSTRLRRSGLLDLDGEQRLFLPDTLIGQITVQLGDRTHRVLFAADPDQAAVQDAPPPKAVLDAADAMYAAAGTVLGVERVGP